MAHLIPVPFAIVSVILLIAAEFREQREKIYLWKPISTLLVIAVAALSLLRPAADPVYTGWLLLALLLSLVGDIALGLSHRAGGLSAGPRGLCGPLYRSERFSVH